MADESPSEKNVFIFMSNYEHIKDYTLYEAKGFICLVVIAYLIFVLKIGPHFMSNRKPYTLKMPLFIHNLVQIVVSVYFTYLGVKIFLETGFLPKRTPEKDPILLEKISYCIYVYWLGKFTELLDTVFFVLRKKNSQLTFLHIYHHASVIFGEYLFFHYSQSMSAVYTQTINSLVHAVMYFYYLVSSLGPQFAKYLTWKKWITDFQRVQFISMFLYQVFSIFYTTGEHAIIGVIYILYSTILFFIMFTNFSNSVYNKKANKEKNVDSGLRVDNEKRN